MYLIDTHTRRETHFFSHPGNKDHVRPQAGRNTFKTSGGKPVVSVENDQNHCVDLGLKPKMTQNLTIYNIIRWFTGLLGQMTRRPSV